MDLEKAETDCFVQEHNGGSDLFNLFKGKTLCSWF